MNSAERIDIMKSNKDTKIALLEQSSQHVIEMLNRIDKRFDGIDKKLENMHLYIKERTDCINSTVEKLEVKIGNMEQRLWSNFYWMLAAMFTLSCAGASILAKGFKWIS